MFHSSAQWPSLLERILPRLDHVTKLDIRALEFCSLTEVCKIVYNMFPIPSIPLPEPPPSSIRNERVDHPSGENTPSPSSQKENVILETPPQRHSPRSRRLPMSPPLFRPIPDSSMAGPPGTLPPQLLSLLSSLKSTLKTSFPDAPPHTAQRFAELILRPTRHYRTLPSYLRALDRVLSVSSPASIFPLPPLIFSMATANGRLLNGSSTPDGSNAPGGDDFIGGAELTPIPWLNVSTMSSYLSSAERAYTSDLRTESTSLIDGPNGAGSLETVTVSINGISSSSRTERVSTTPLSSHNPLHENSHPNQNGTHTSLPSSMTGEANSEEVTEEIVTARGPDAIGMEDIGPQAPETQNFVVHPERHGDEIETSGATTRIERRSRESGEMEEGEEREEGEEEEGATSPRHMRTQQNRPQRTRLLLSSSSSSASKSPTTTTTTTTTKNEVEDDEDDEDEDEEIEDDEDEGEDGEVETIMRDSPTTAK